MSAPEPPETAVALDVEERVRFEALDRLYTLHGSNASMSALLVPVLAVSVMWSEIDHWVLLSWLTVFVLAKVVAHVTVRVYLRQPHAMRRDWVWGHRLTAITAVYGVLWAAAIPLFYAPDSSAHQVFVIILAILLSTGATFRSLYWLPLIYVYALPILAALALQLILIGGFPYWVLAFFVCWSGVFVVRMATAMNRNVWSEMKLRYRSADLADALRAKTAEAERATFAKSRFLAAASHDLRQPLHALTLFVDALKNADTEPERARILSRVEYSLEALKKLFDGLLDVSRLDANVIVPECRHFDLAGLLGDLVDEFRPEARAKNLKLVLRTRPTVVVSDRILLERVIRNLLANAIRYTDSGGILLSARNRGDEVLLQVWDTGIGIAEQDREEVFHEFVQLHNPNRDRTEGLGLGLAIVQRLCWLLQIPIELRSRQGRGSVFGLCLMRGNEALVQNMSAAPPPARWDLSNHCVLVIDDEQEILEAMGVLLSQWGLRVVVGLTHEAALEELQRRKLAPDLMLVDMRLAEKANGIDVMNAIRGRFGAPIPGILITGDTGPEQIATAQSSGYKVLHKPVRPPRLRSMVQRALATGTGQDS